MTTKRPDKIICVGLNYRDHAEESGFEPPQRPIIFAKWSSSIIGHHDAIVLPTISDQVDYEAELALVISRPGRNIPVERALEHVGGYMCLNDVTARDLQFADGQWARAKSLDTFCPIGPVVPASSIADPQNLHLRCVLNGDVVQESNTANMIFSIPQLIAFTSEGIRLEPGDIIATGTPAGIGYAQDPPRYLQPGDVVSVAIESIGELVNPVVATRPS